MNQLNTKSYAALIEQLIDASDMKEKLAILENNCHLIDREFIKVAQNKASTLLIQGNLEDSEWLESFANKLEDRMMTWEQLNRRTVQFYKEHDYELALETASRALDVAREIWTGDRLEVAKNLSNMALVLKAQGKLKKAEPYYRDTLAMRYRIYEGEARRDLAKCFSNLGEVLEVQGRSNEAEPYYRDAWKMKQQLSC